MNKIIKTDKVLALLCGLAPFFVNSQVHNFQEITHPKYIKTIMFWNSQTQNSTPIISLGEEFYLSFDDLEANSKQYRYKIVRYTYDWKKSILFSSEYIDGFSDGLIQNRKHSIQTLVPYIHYQVNIPNKKTRIKKSGNYGIRIYIKKKGKYLFERRFMIVEPHAISIQAEIGRPQRSRLRQTHQNLEFKVAFSPREDFERNSRNIHIYAFKNNNIESMTGDLKPSFINRNEVIFHKNDALDFEGGNEFRWFNTKDIRASSLTTAKSVKTENGYETYLSTDEELFQKPYFYQDDINGEYVIINADALDENSSSTNADYSTVIFTLESRLVPWDFDLYVVGAFNNWQLNEESRMDYMEDQKLYRLHLFLKQGYYNYKYVAKEKRTGKVFYSDIDGSHWQTENNYNILVYYRKWNERFDQLIGYATVKSIQSLE